MVVLATCRFYHYTSGLQQSLDGAGESSIIIHFGGMAGHDDVASLVLFSTGHPHNEHIPWLLSGHPSHIWSRSNQT